MHNIGLKIVDSMLAVNNYLERIYNAIVTLTRDPKHNLRDPKRNL